VSKLRISYADGRSEERELAPGKYLVGRELGDIVLADENVSARHAEIEVHAEGIKVTDLGSRNGIFDSRGQRISGSHNLSPNQHVRLGATSLTWLRPVGEAGGTRVMPEMAMPGGTRVMAAPPPLAAAPPPAAVPPAPVTAAPAGAAPVMSGAAVVGSPAAAAQRAGTPWLARLGVAVGVVVAFIAIKVCTRIAKVVTAAPTSAAKCQIVDGGWKEGMRVAAQPDYAIDAVLMLKNVGQDGEIQIRAVLSTSEGEFERTQKLVLKANQTQKVTYQFHEPSVNVRNVQLRPECGP
jgi:pSer/pThr/pTyr-binding forkhead associated (FHA) protein